MGKRGLTPRSRMSREHHIQGYLSLIPVLVAVLLVKAYPTIVTIVKSFTNWDGLFKNDWVGLSNYVSVFQSSFFWTMLRNSLLMLLHIPLLLILGFVVSALLYEGVPGWRLFRVLYFIPAFISPIVIGYLFRFAFGFRGPVNGMLRAVGLNFLAVEWLGTGYSGIFVLIISFVWQSLGWQTLLILSGMASISPSVLESCTLEGAGYWRRLFRIIVPMLKNVVVYSTMMGFIWVFAGGIFPFIYATTGGGPGYETTTIDYMIYLKTFVEGNKMGVSCALAVMLLVFILTLSRFQLRILESSESLE
jgi:multiple sugar transport system permease protein